MVQVKTLTESRNKTEKFDDKVNKHLAEGWELVRRYVVPGFSVRDSGEVYPPQWVAELQRRVPDED